MGHVRRLIVVSNRLPVTVLRRDGEVHTISSVGGLATGLKPLYQAYESLWVGWPGVRADEVTAEERAFIVQRLSQARCVPVWLTRQQLRGYYFGFCNKTLWPLFHYFPQYTVYDDALWQAYRQVNEVFCDQVLRHARPDDILWVHDYHLMLLPAMLREALPKARIGFFLHIPFPSFELFRLLPWRREILEGLLGADLIGFHTYDYVLHFLASVRHVLGYEHTLGRIETDKGVVQVDAFPMGIDYRRFARAGRSRRVRRQARRIRQKMGSRKIVLSVDRLDYTKGIPQRLQAFATLLERYPAFRGQVTLVLVAAPSRIEIRHYKALKDHVDMLVGQINGQYGSVEWVPVWYYSRSLPFSDLVALYRAADVAFITPLRDGMNLVAKEYLATRVDNRGVLILSEMTGAAKELGEALIVNPNNPEELVEALRQALTMDVAEQRERNRILRGRLRRYDVVRWARDFMDRLEEVKAVQAALEARYLTDEARRGLVEAYRRAQTRLLLLDYDGTLVPIVPQPDQAQADPELLDLLRTLAGDPANEVVLISGRDRKTLDQWLGSLPVSMVAEHGVWVRERGGPWTLIDDHLSPEWKRWVRPLMELYAERTPGAIIEEKDYSLAWHYRKADSAIAEVRSRELRNALLHLTVHLGVDVLEGDRVLEVRNAGIHKGHAARRWLARQSWDFILAVGDDRTDEDVFEVLPPQAYTLRVGLGPSKARFSVHSYRQVRQLLRDLVGTVRIAAPEGQGGGDKGPLGRTAS